MFPCLSRRSPILSSASISPCTSACEKKRDSLLSALIPMKISNTTRRRCSPRSAWGCSQSAAVFRGIGRSSLAFTRSCWLGAGTKSCRSSDTTTECAFARSRSTGADSPAAHIRKLFRGGSSCRRKREGASPKFSTTPLWRFRLLSALFFSAWAITRRANRRRRNNLWVHLPDGSVVVAEQNCGCENRGPQSALIPDRRLSDVHGANDLVRNAVDLFFLVPR